jgi:hypothetical protein
MNMLTEDKTWRTGEEEEMESRGQRGIQKLKTVFGNGLNLRKWIGIIINLIDIRKKVRIFCIKNENFDNFLFE